MWPGLHGLLLALVPLSQCAGDLMMVPMGLDPPNEGRMSGQGARAFAETWPGFQGKYDGTST